MKKTNLCTILSFLSVFLFSACQQSVVNEYRTVYVNEKAIACGSKEFDTLQEACNYAITLGMDTSSSDLVPEIKVKTNIKSSSITLPGNSSGFLSIDTGYYIVTFEDGSVFDLGSNSIILKGDGGCIKAENSATIKGGNNDYLMLSGNISLENINLDTFAGIVEDEDFCGTVKGNIKLSSAFIQVNSKYGWYDIGEFAINKRTDEDLQVHSGFYFNVEKSYKDAVKIASVSGDDTVKYPIQYESNLIEPSKFVSLDASIVGGIHKHIYSQKEHQEAENCLHNSLFIYICDDSNCGTRYEKIVADGKHSLETVEAKDIGDNSYGNKAHYKCSLCNKVFMDENGSNGAEYSDVLILSGHLTQAELNDAELKTSLNNLVKLTGVASDSETRYEKNSAKAFNGFWKYFKYAMQVPKFIKMVHDVGKIMQNSKQWTQYTGPIKNWINNFPNATYGKVFCKGLSILNCAVSIVNFALAVSGANTAAHDAIIDGLNSLNKGLDEINNNLKVTESFTREIELELSKALAKLTDFANKTDKYRYVKMCNERTQKLGMIKDRINICYDSLMKVTDPMEKQEILDMWKKCNIDTASYLEDYYKETGFGAATINVKKCIDETLKYTCAFRNDYYFALGYAFAENESILQKAIVLEQTLMSWYPEQYSKKKVETFNEIATTYELYAMDFSSELNRQYLIQDEFDVVYCAITDSYYKKNLAEVEYQITDELNEKFNMWSSYINQVKSIESQMPTYEILADGTKRTLDSFKKTDIFESPEVEGKITFEFSPASFDKLAMLSAWFDDPADITTIFCEENGFTNFNKSRINKSCAYLLDPTSSNPTYAVNGYSAALKKGYVIKTGTSRALSVVLPGLNVDLGVLGNNSCLFTYQYFLDFDRKHKVPNDSCQYFVLFQGNMESTIKEPEYDFE